MYTRSPRELGREVANLIEDRDSIVKFLEDINNKGIDISGVMYSLKPFNNGKEEIEFWDGLVNESTERY